MKLIPPAAMLVSCALTACSAESEPPAFAHLHEDAFVVAHFDLNAIRDSDVFKRLLELEEPRKGWTEMQSDFTREMGFDMSALSELTFTGIETRESRPGVLLYLRGNEATDAVELSRPQSVENGDYNAGSLRADIEEAGMYWIEVESRNDSYDRRPFEGELRGTGPIAAAFVAAPVDPQTGYIGPVQVDEGGSLEITAEWEHASTLTLMRSATPLRVGECDAYPMRYDGFLARLDDGLIVMGDDLVHYRDRSEEDAWRNAVTNALETKKPTGGLFDALAGLPSRRAIIGASSWSAIPRKGRQELVEGIGRVLSEREAMALHEIETVALEVKLDDGIASRAEIVCEDEEGAEEVFDLMQDLLDLAEAFRGLPREAEEVLELVRVEQKGLTVRLELDIDAEQIDKLIRLAAAPAEPVRGSTRMVSIAKASIVEIEKAAVQFYLDNNSYPETLEQLVTKDGSGAKYLKQDSIPKDPWGQEYIIESDGDEILIWTYGADKQEGGEGKNRDFNNKMITNQEI